MGKTQMPKRGGVRTPDNAIRNHLREAERMRMRLSAQISNQKQSIDRLLRDGNYDNEMTRLHEELAEAQSQIQELKEG